MCRAWAYSGFPVGGPIVEPPPAGRFRKGRPHCECSGCPLPSEPSWLADNAHPACLDKGGPVLAGAVFGDGDVAASRQRFDLQEDFRHPIPHILVVDDLTMPRGRRDGGEHFAHQLLVGFIHADERELWIVGRVVNIEHVFHAHDKSGATIGWDFPVFAQVRLKLVFFNARCTLMVETLGAMFSSTTFSASSPTVHRARPAGAGEHPKAVNRASKAPSKVSFRGLAEGLRSNAASIPSSTNLALRCSMVRVLTPSASATSATFQGLPCSPAS